MDHILRDHALENINCSPFQDSQFTTLLKRASGTRGASNAINLYGRYINLPVRNTRYHVFTLGRSGADGRGLLQQLPEWTHNRWFNLAEVLRESNLFSNVHNQNGKEYPKFACWYMITNENFLIFAMEEHLAVGFDFIREPVYWRTYTNSYFNSPRNDLELNTWSDGKVIKVTTDILNIQNKITQLNELPGKVMCFVNGVYVSNINVATVALGDVVEYIYDGSIEETIYMKIGDLDEFISRLDNSHKYLLLRNDTRDSFIDYFDDLEIHLVTANTGNGMKGLYYHRSNPKAIRMVTHRDYSVEVDYINYLAARLNEVEKKNTSAGEYYLEVKVRRSGLERPLVFEHSRIAELYKLPFDLRRAAMMGMNSIELWRPEALEESWYVRLMNGKWGEYTQSNLEAAYGYNSASKVVAESMVVMEVYGNVRKGRLSKGLENGCTVYEYNELGLLEDVVWHESGMDYITANSNCVFIEALLGKATDTPDYVFGKDGLEIPTDGPYRVYKTREESGLPKNEWQDVTGTTSYTIEDGKLKNRGRVGNEYYLVKGTKSYPALKETLGVIRGILEFELHDVQDLGDRGTAMRPMQVPGGEFELFCNGRSLIRGIDFEIKFPKVVVWNKEYLSPQDNNQKIVTRFRGFCTPEMELNEINDKGFISQGVLSDNDTFNIRDDKVLHISVDGQVYLRSELDFDEDTEFRDMFSQLNGRSYQVKNQIVPMRTSSVRDVYELRDRDLINDQLVIGYMNEHMPKTERAEISVMPRRKILYSPVFSRFIKDVKENLITPMDLMALRDENDVSEYIRKRYSEYFDLDPLFKDPDYRYIVIHPHHEPTVVGVNVAAFNVLGKMNKVFANGKVVLTDTVKIEE